MVKTDDNVMIMIVIIKVNSGRAFTDLRNQEVNILPLFIIIIIIHTN